MLVERARGHYEALGWTVTETDPLWPDPARPPSLFLERKGQKRALLVEAETLGTYEIGRFAADCRKAKMKGMVICMLGEGTVEACEQFGVDYVSPEGLGEPKVVREKDVITAAIPSRVAAPTVAPTSPVAEPARAPTPWWRWALVAAVWAAAIYMVIRLVLHIT